jgi:iron complex transport system substrate-binding protein
MAAPAQRIISLAPHITELLYAIGAGDALIATVEHSDYPQAAKHLPRIGKHNALDLERIVYLQPDLVIAWQSGNPDRQVNKLIDMGLTVFYSEPRTLMDIARTLERFALLTGSNESMVKNEFVTRYQTLRRRYTNQKTVAVFYEIWNQPLMTVGGKHIISEVIELCGGRNVFGELSALAPTVSVEAVIKADPQVIIASSIGDERPEWLAQWDRWPNMRAVESRHVHHINSDLINRHTVRLLDGAQRLCEILDQARQP